MFFQPEPNQSIDTELWRERKQFRLIWCFTETSLVKVYPGDCFGGGMWSTQRPREQVQRLFAPPVHVSCLCPLSLCVTSPLYTWTFSSWLVGEVCGAQGEQEESRTVPCGSPYCRPLCPKHCPESSHAVAGYWARPGSGTWGAGPQPWAASHMRSQHHNPPDTQESSWSTQQHPPHHNQRCHQIRRVHSLLVIPSPRCRTEPVRTQRLITTSPVETPLSVYVSLSLWTCASCLQVLISVLTQRIQHQMF